MLNKEMADAPNDILPRSAFPPRDLVPDPPFARLREVKTPTGGGVLPALALFCESFGRP